MGNDKSLAFGFPLYPDDDGWPPASLEWMLFERAGAHYKLKSAPFFIRELSTGDILSISSYSDGRVVDWCVKEKSTTSTIWFYSSDDFSARIRLDLLSLGCAVESLPAFEMFSVSVPESVSLEKVDRVLAAISHSVAYPSLRHDEAENAGNVKT